jgi:hypothetical protein
MKRIIIISIVSLLIASGINIKAQDKPAEYLGLPGDNLNLYAVMELFQKSATLEDFERNLNDENSRINNLDLNGDGLIDYISVNDYVDGDVHTIVLSVPLNRNEKQDVAVFTVQRFRNGPVQIQLIGDDELYGKNYIIEPIYDDNAVKTPNPGYTGNNPNINVVRTTTLEIAAWPLIGFIYRPDYRIWHSSWYWGYYPPYWHPWRPFFWDYYYGYYHNWYPDYYRHYRHWDQPRYIRYNDFYYSNLRSHSREVNVRITEGNYKATYSHPEQRRDGEALYTKLHSDRSSVSGPASDRRSVNTNQNRTNVSAGQNEGNSRRSVSTVNRRSSNTSSGQNAATSRRSSGTGNVSSKPEPTQRKETVKSSSEKPEKSIKKSDRKSEKKRKSETSVKKDEKNKESETEKSRRK